MLDLFKAVGCLLIVLHHLAFYGPMSDVVARHWPGPIGWLADHGRLAVQLFLVCSGYLTAASFAKRPEFSLRQLLTFAWRRYLRLALPLLAALSLAVLVTEAIRNDFQHPSLSGTPDWPQALAHVFFLQHVLDMEALSAGVWYVAIDFQLYLLTLLALWSVSQWVRWHPGWRAEALRVQVFVGLTLLSLLYWNLHADLDLYGVYFFGAYGMGWLAYRTRRSRRPAKGWVILAGMGLLALWVDARLRIATSWSLAVVLAAAPQVWLQSTELPSRWRAAVSLLARVSYSVFVIHYAVMLAVSAAVAHWWPQSVFWDGVGMLLTLAVSVLAALGLHRLTEQKSQDWRHWLFWVGVFMASCALAMHWGANSG